MLKRFNPLFEISFKPHVTRCPTGVLTRATFKIQRTLSLPVGERGVVPTMTEPLRGLRFLPATYIPLKNKQRVAGCKRIALMYSAGCLVCPRIEFVFNAIDFVSNDNNFVRHASDLIFQEGRLMLHRVLFCVPRHSFNLP